MRAEPTPTAVSAYGSGLGPRPPHPPGADESISPGTRRPSVRGLVSLLTLPALRRLVGVRALSSFGDGAFQGALAGAVLFSPERATEPAAIAAGFAILLLPYSIVGPFAGALLDRWDRRRVIVWANVIRSLLVVVVAAQVALDLPWAALFGTALLIMGVGRFVGSGLSAAVPHTVADDSLVGANALATTSGAIATAVGGGYAIAMRSVIGETPLPMAVVTASVMLFYLASAALAARYRPRALGPDHTDEPAQTVRAVLDGFHSALKHVLQRPTVGTNILLIVLVRFCFGLCTLVVLLLFQHTFTTNSGIFRSGLAGIAEVLAVGAVGLFLGAVVTAPTVRLVGRTRYLVFLLTITAVLVVICGSQFTQLTTMIATLVVSFCYQSSKVCADTVVQADSDDAFVGRVFALYDTANNLFYVLAFSLGVLIVPHDGQGIAAVVLVGAVLLLCAVGYGLAARRTDSAADPQPVATV
ncbi:MFS transporter [Nakamurella leprariae]|uniref:MFS transporter n=1 Tax=Nakamurella leprariae TaxID=2803911 RepID=A0A938YG85_9ACTN|nr:MFS transporter [Nakamurella leprariae]MBM9468951.1 MFS transporter [Nakamurella leprariae]